MLSSFLPLLFADTEQSGCSSQGNPNGFTGRNGPGGSEGPARDRPLPAGLSGLFAASRCRDEAPPRGCGGERPAAAAFPCICPRCHDLPRRQLPSPPASHSAGPAREGPGCRCPGEQRLAGPLSRPHPPSPAPPSSPPPPPWPPRSSRRAPRGGTTAPSGPAAVPPEASRRPVPGRYLRGTERGCAQRSLPPAAAAGERRRGPAGRPGPSGSRLLPSSEWRCPRLPRGGQRAGAG